MLKITMDAFLSLTFLERSKTTIYNLLSFAIFSYKRLYGYWIVYYSMNFILDESFFHFKNNFFVSVGLKFGSRSRYAEVPSTEVFHQPCWKTSKLFGIITPLVITSQLKKSLVFKFSINYIRVSTISPVVIGMKRFIWSLQSALPSELG